MLLKQRYCKIDEFNRTAMKLFNTMFNVGKAKYVVCHHDGTAKHKDGSPFFDMKLFKNKKLFESFQKKLLADNYLQVNL